MDDSFFNASISVVSLGNKRRELDISKELEIARRNKEIIEEELVLYNAANTDLRIPVNDNHRSRK